jgi:predicted nucleic acid-binding protein
VKEVSFEKSNESKSIKRNDVENTRNTYDVALILDADNILPRDFISKTTQSMQVIMWFKDIELLKTPKILLC